MSKAAQSYRVSSAYLKIVVLQNKHMEGILGCLLVQEIWTWHNGQSVAPLTLTRFMFETST